MEVDGTEKESERMPGEEVSSPSVEAFKQKQPDGPLGETVVAKGHPASIAHQLLCRCRNYSPELADKALPSGLTF